MLPVLEPSVAAVIPHRPCVEARTGDPVTAEALDLTAARVGAEPASAIPAPARTRTPSAEHLTPVRGYALAAAVPAVTGIDLVAPGPGDELVSSLAAVLTELEGVDTPDADPADAPDRETEHLLRLFDAQAGSRWLEVAAHRLRAAGVRSAVPGPVCQDLSGALALAVRPTDPALLPFSWRAFQLARGARGKRTNILSSGVGRGLLDVARGLVGSAREPLSGGRHPGGGQPGLAMVPLSSMAAGHLSRAVGIAWVLGRQKRLPASLRTILTWPDDALVIAGLDAAAVNHATAAGAINTACWMAYQAIPLPLLLVCADTTSTRSPTPPGWVGAHFSSRVGLEYRYDDGSDPTSSPHIAQEAAQLARERQVPVLLHLRCTPVEKADPHDVDLIGEPLADTMRALAASGVLSGEQVHRRWVSIRDEVAACVEEALREPSLGADDADDVMTPLAPHRPEVVAARAAAVADPADRARVFGPLLPENEGRLTLAEAINRTLLDLGAATPRLLFLGEDVAGVGGRHGVAAGLHHRLGASRVIDTLPDERTILGLALGAGICGLLPVAELSSAAALHTAIDQLRCEAASLTFHSQGAFRNPLVVRVPGLAHRPDAGQPFGLDHAIGALRDIPGLVIACPAHPCDAPAMVRTCLAAATADGTVTVILEPAGLYHERDLITRGDEAWLGPYRSPARWGQAHVPLGQAATWGDGGDLTIVTFGHGLRMSLRVAARLARTSIAVRVVDLRWLAPLPVEDVLREASATGRCLVVDETRRSGGVAEALVTALLEGGYAGRLARINADDSWLPQGPAADLLLISEADIEDAAHTLLE